MASQTSTTAQRGILSPLNVNATINSPSIGSKTGRAQESTELGEALLRKSVKGCEMSDPVREETGLASTKRRVDNTGGLGQDRDGPCRKKHKARSALQSHEATDGMFGYNVPGVLVGGDSEARPAKTLGSPPGSNVDALSLSSSATSSPASSSGFSDAALNDTQITEPEEVHPVPTMTQAELRQKAQAIKLRLRLANYKVRTNQIHVPMSRLQIRTISSDSLPSARVKLQQQISLSATTPSTNPNILVQKPSAESARQAAIISSSPPRMHLNTASSPNKKFISPTKAAGGEIRDGFATPLLPRHRQGLLNPPNLGGAIWDEQSPGKELTSSVVKRGTADALLSLKHQR